MVLQQACENKSLFFFSKGPTVFTVIPPRHVHDMLSAPYFRVASDLRALSVVDLRRKALTSFSLCWFFTLQHLKAFCCRDNGRADTAPPDTRSSDDGIPSAATRFPLLRSDLCQVLPSAIAGECVHSGLALNSFQRLVRNQTKTCF